MTVKNEQHIVLLTIYFHSVTLDADEAIFLWVDIVKWFGFKAKLAYISVSEVMAIL